MRARAAQTHRIRTSVRCRQARAWRPGLPRQGLQGGPEDVHRDRRLHRCGGPARRRRPGHASRRPGALQPVAGGGSRTVGQALPDGRGQGQEVGRLRDPAQPRPEAERGRPAALRLAPPPAEGVERGRGRPRRGRRTGASPRPPWSRERPTPLRGPAQDRTELLGPVGEDRLRPPPRHASVPHPMDPPRGVRGRCADCDTVRPGSQPPRRTLPRAWRRGGLSGRPGGSILAGTPGGDDVARMIPSPMAATVESEAERLLYGKFAHELPGEYTVIHGARWVGSGEGGRPGRGGGLRGPPPGAGGSSCSRRRAGRPRWTGAPGAGCSARGGGAGPCPGPLRPGL